MCYAHSTHIGFELTVINKLCHQGEMTFLYGSVGYSWHNHVTIKMIATVPFTLH
jgi:hypothetical protein